ncbi:tripartite tricarboxylate transporter TctB family protein [Virgibacillus sp. C22-A2]|uniref:Tripartite tricarboxylate transporter TctB family protein n=1 Tax=Virgibacillus tibetensis TaxID=3042313 RepID=A0ABU6KE17_9BACI|nr:tripartite tricarboxylate transporter TctB family protein [Virgibacillus sp. C22-A2]
MGEILIGILLIIFSALIYFNSGDFPQLNETHLDPGSYPKLIALLLILLSLILIIKKTVRLLKSNTISFDSGFKDFMKKQWKEYHLVVYTLVILALYILLMNVLGFIISSIAFIIAAGLLIGPRKKKDVMVISLISFVITFGVYLFFENVLYVRFPNGILF